MWPRSSSCLLALSLVVGAQIGGLDSLLDQFESQGQPTPDQLQRNLTQLSGGLRQWGGAGNPRVRGYLNGMQGRVGRNRNLGLSMSGLYRQLGGLESNPQMAWLSYRNAFLMLNQLPMDGQVRGEMQQIRRSVEVIEARMPELPRLDWSQLDSASQKDYDAVMERYITASATASSAEVTAETMRRSLADQGLAVRPEVISGLTRMKLKLEDAKRLIEQQNYSAAQDRLASVEAEAKRILKSFGG